MESGNGSNFGSDFGSKSGGGSGMNAGMGYMNHPHADWKAKDVGELLTVVTDKVPELVGKLLHTLYSEAAAKEMGKAVGSLYKELVASGIPNETALKMTSDYMFSLKDLTSHGFINNNIHGGRSHNHNG